MYDRSIRHYDRLYAGKDYPAEVKRLRHLIGDRLRTEGRRLLDVACGTGRHLELLRTFFEAEGLDVSPGQLELARERNPDLRFHEADMASFDLGRTYDVLTCLFSSIGYVKTLEMLRATAATFARHLVPGGLVLVEPWFTPDEWKPGTPHAVFIDDPDLKIARVNTSYREGRLSWFDLHYLVGTPTETEHYVERHEMGLFETAEMVEAFEGAGFDVEYDEQGLIGRGLLIGTRRA